MIDSMAVSLERLKAGKPERLEFIQYLRAICACMVVLYHISHYYVNLLEPTSAYLKWFGPWLGFYGVSFFFVISGFLMAGLVRTQSFKKFLGQRFMRIYPGYWLAIVLWFVSIIPFVVNERPSASALLLLPSGPEPRILGVEWTLIFEVYFYFVMSVLCLRDFSKWVGPFLCAWGALIIGIFLIGHGSAALVPRWVEILVSVWALPFIFGGVLKVLATSRGVPWAPVFVVAVVFVAVGESWNHAAAVLPKFVGIAGIFYSCLRINWDRFSRYALARILKRMGDVSYGVYLSHVVACLFFARGIINYAPNLVGPWTYFAMMFFVFNCAIFFGFAELRFFEAIRKRSQPQPSK